MDTYLLDVRLFLTWVRAAPTAVISEGVKEATFFLTFTLAQPPGGKVTAMYRIEGYSQHSVTNSSCDTLISASRKSSVHVQRSG